MRGKHKESDLPAATMALISAANDAPEIGRRALPACVLGQENQSMPLISDEEIRETQHDDGGWTNVPETVLLSVICRLRPTLHDCYLAALSWLRNVRGLLLYLPPELSGQKAINWLKNEWGKDFKDNTRLTYKGSFFCWGCLLQGYQLMTVR